MDSNILPNSVQSVAGREAVGGGRDVILGSKPVEYCWRLATEKSKRMGS